MAKIDLVTALMICIDMLDRVEGTALYDIQKKHYGYSDKEYQESIKHLEGIYNFMRKRQQEE